MIQLAASIESIARLLEGRRQAFVIAHFNPDADAYGSSCGLAFGLRSFGITATVLNESGTVARYSTIPGVAEVQAVPPERAPGPDDIVLVCDCGSIERAGDSLVPWIQNAPLVVNIDHHVSNSNFGHHNLVIESASSTSEIVFDLLRCLQQNRVDQSNSRSDIISTECAGCLMAGIIGDTGSFRYPSTSAHTFDVAAELVRRGARPDSLVQKLFSTHTLSAVRLQAEALLALNLEHGGRFAEIVVTREMLTKTGADLLDADSLAERGRDIEGVLVSALFKQDIDMWRVSLRSRDGVDVSVIARKFGGGGHRPAAAFRWKRDFETLRTELRDSVAEALAYHAYHHSA